MTASAEGYNSVSVDITYNDFMTKKTIIMDFDLEPDPNNPSVFLSPGLNLFGCPFKVQQGYASSDLITYLGREEGISTIKVLGYDFFTLDHRMMYGASRDLTKRRAPMKKPIMPLASLQGKGFRS